MNGIQPSQQLQIRTKPGYNNSLGLVKFNFANRHSVVYFT